MIRSVLLQPLLIFLFVFLSCSPQSEQTPTEVPEGSLTEKLDFIKEKSNFNSESERLEALFALYVESQKEASPIMSTFLGKPGYDHLWDDFSPEGIQQNLDRQKMFYETRDWFLPEDLTDQEAVNYNIYNATIRDNYVLNSTYPQQYLSIDQIQGIHNMIPAVIQMMPATNAEQFENIQSRIEGIPTLLEQVQVVLQEGVDKGIVMPRNTVVQVPDQLKILISETPEESVFYGPFSRMKEDIELEGKESMKEEIRNTIKDEINPALARFNTFMEEIYLPNARETYGLKELPDGEAWYNERIKYFTTTELSAKEIHEIGLSEVARIRKEMEKIASEQGYDDFEAFNEFLREDPQFYFDTPEELLSAYRDICKRIDPILPTLFGHLPRLPYGVKRVPAYSEKATTTAYYQPGSLENGVPGYFFANTWNLKSRPKWEMEALSIHEAVPGHHLQVAIAQELEGLPEFRSMVFFTAYVEGWGLYSESLGPDLGMYTDPYSKYGQLTYEIWRAIRLVVDTGIHAFGWTRQEAIDYFVANSGKSENDITVEVDRYIAWPGQALAYKIGELKIQELRKRAEDTLGEKFDIRAFHDVVLGSGAVPLEVLEENVDQWIEGQKEA